MLQTKEETIFWWPVASWSMEVQMKQIWGKGEGKEKYEKNKRQVSFKGSEMSVAVHDYIHKSPYNPSVPHTSLIWLIQLSGICGLLDKVKVKVYFCSISEHKVGLNKWEWQAATRVTGGSLLTSKMLHNHTWPYPAYWMSHYGQNHLSVLVFSLLSAGFLCWYLRSESMFLNLI